jgi:ornithine carbamoyltransferase
MTQHSVLMDTSLRVPTRHFLALNDFSKAEYDYLFNRVKIIKQYFKSYTLYHPLKDRTLAMVFEKQSTRTRVSFEAGMKQLGGNSIFLTTENSQLGRGEPIEDTAKVITRMVDIVLIRTYEQAIIERFSAYSRVPVVNGLTNEYHPCQVLADIYTYIEHRGSIQGKTVVWVGDAFNMLYTWMQAAAIFDFKLNIAIPASLALTLDQLAPFDQRYITFFADPMEATRHADLVTTDVWSSMGFESEADSRKTIFEGFQVDARMMAQAKSDALFMHCLPAHRGEEVSAEVLDGPQSVVWDEAENRLHVQKALLEFLLIGAVN